MDELKDWFNQTLESTGDRLSKISEAGISPDLGNNFSDIDSEIILLFKCVYGSESEYDRLRSKIENQYTCKRWDRDLWNCKLLLFFSLIDCLKSLPQKKPLIQTAIGKSNVHSLEEYLFQKFSFCIPPSKEQILKCSSGLVDLYYEVLQLEKEAREQEDIAKHIKKVSDFTFTYIPTGKEIKSLTKETGKPDCSKWIRLNSEKYHCPAFIKWKTPLPEELPAILKKEGFLKFQIPSFELSMLKAEMWIWENCGPGYYPYSYLLGEVMQISHVTEEQIIKAIEIHKLRGQHPVERKIWLGKKGYRRLWAEKDRGKGDGQWNASEIETKMQNSTDGFSMHGVSEWIAVRIYNGNPSRCFYLENIPPIMQIMKEQHWIQKAEMKSERVSGGRIEQTLSDILDQFISQKKTEGLFTPDSVFEKFNSNTKLEKKRMLTSIKKILADKEKAGTIFKGWVHEVVTKTGRTDYKRTRIIILRTKRSYEKFCAKYPTIVPEEKQVTNSAK